jgi:FixJ family two-component response regulator
MLCADTIPTWVKLAGQPFNSFTRKKHKAMLDAISTTNLVTIVDDDESVRDALKGFLQSAGFAAEIFSSATDLLGSNVLDKTSCLIVDVHMPVMTGLELQRRLSNSRFRIPMIFITARDDPQARAQAVKAGAIDFLQKPFAADALLGAIHAALVTKTTH